MAGATLLRSIQQYVHDKKTCFTFLLTKSSKNCLVIHDIESKSIVFSWKIEPEWWNVESAVLQW